MTTEEQIQNWIDIAERDLPVAESLYENGHYTYCLYIGHLILEKILKARYVKDKKVTPPKTHNLVYLANATTLDFDESQKQFLFKANSFNLEARYIDYKNQFYKLCTNEFANENFKKIKEMYKWIKSQVK